VIKNLSFIEGDIVAEKKSDEYFSQKKVKTRKVSLNSSPTYIDKDGDISIIDENYSHWLILGNTCDLTRENNSGKKELPHLTHVAPLTPIEKDMPENVLSDLKHYKLFKKMYVPRWNEYIADHYLDFTIINSIEKECLTNKASVDISKPIILAEICPERYNVIDGNHRMAKARKLGVLKLQAYKLKMNQHIRFLITKEGYESYVQYWNSKT